MPGAADAVTDVPVDGVAGPLVDNVAAEDAVPDAPAPCVVDVVADEAVLSTGADGADDVAVEPADAEVEEVDVPPGPGAAGDEVADEDDAGTLPAGAFDVPARAAPEGGDASDGACQANRPRLSAPAATSAHHALRGVGVAAIMLLNRPRSGRRSRSGPALVPTRQTGR